MAYVNLGLPTMFSRAKRSAQLAADGFEAGIDAIIFSAITIEAFPNDFATIASFDVKHRKDVDPRLKTVVEILIQAEHDRIQIKLKYQLLYYALTGMPVITGKPPFQDFTFLIDLRNSLVHHKPDLVEDHGKFNKEIKGIHAGLIQRKLVKRDAKFMPYDWKALLDEDPRVASWSVDTAVELIKWIVDLLPKCTAREYYMSSGIYKWESKANPKKSEQVAPTHP